LDDIATSSGFANFQQLNKNEYMEYFKLKEELLAEKLKLLRFQKEKNEAAKNQDFEKAASLRDQEKQSYDKIQELTLAVLEKEQRLKETEEDMKKLKENEK
jgi:hypothetical protein